MSTFLDTRDSDLFDRKVKILTEDPRIKNKWENPLFYSTNQQIQGEMSHSLSKETKKEDDLGKYMLGRNLQKVLSEENNNIKSIQSHIEKEKLRID